MPVTKVKLNERSCFKGKVKLGRRGVVAKVDLEGRSVRSNRNGGYRLCQTVHWAGTHAVYAFKGKRRAHDTFKVGTGMTASPRWERIEIQLLAYRDSPLGGWCGTGSPVQFGVARVDCVGWSNPNTDGQFSGKRLAVTWNSEKNPTSLWFDYRGDYCPCVYGWIDGPGARIFHATGGDPGLEDEGGYAMGGDPDKLGQPGGPWLLKATEHFEPLGLYQNGWTIHVIGYAYQTRS